MCVCVWLTVEEVGVEAALPQLHHGVHEAGHIGVGGPLHQEVKVALQDGSVVLLLDVGQLNLQE